MAASGKADGALMTISEVSDQFGIPQHILRYWETRFPELRPLTRAGKRRYYRPADVALVARIDALLNREGYTIKGVQKLLASRSGTPAAAAAPPQLASPAPPPVARVAPPPQPTFDLKELRRIRDGLAAALVADAF